MVKIYKQPFAHDGDTIAIPDASQPDGKISSADGWTPDYQLPKTDPNYKPVGRQEMNGVFKEVTEALGQVQVQGAASWSADGAPYPVNAQVYHNSKQWLALRANSVEPTNGEDWTDVSEALGNRAVSVATIYDLITNEDYRREGLQLSVASFFEGENQGGGVFVWEAYKPKSSHDGGIVIDPDKVFPDNWNTGSWFYASPEGVGCFVRILSDVATPEMYGAHNGYDDRQSVQGAFNSNRPVIVSGKYLINSISEETTKHGRTVGLVLRDRIKVSGRGVFEFNVSCDYAVGALDRISQFNLDGLTIQKGSAPLDITVGLGLNEDYCPYGTLTNIRTYGFTHGILWATFVSTMTGCVDGNSINSFSIQNPNYLAGADTSLTAATSLTMTACYSISSKEVAFNFGMMVYSTLNSCAADRVNLVFYIARAMGLTINGQGVEGANSFMISLDTRGLSLNGGYLIGLGETSEEHQPDTAPDHFFRMGRTDNTNGRFELSQYEIRKKNPAIISDVWVNRGVGYISGNNDLTHTVTGTGRIIDIEKVVTVIERGENYIKYSDGTVTISMTLTGLDWSIPGNQNFQLPVNLKQISNLHDAGVSILHDRRQVFDQELAKSAGSLVIASDITTPSEIRVRVTEPNVRSDNYPPRVVINGFWA